MEINLKLHLPPFPPMNGVDVQPMNVHEADVFCWSTKPYIHTSPIFLLLTFAVLFILRSRFGYCDLFMVAIRVDIPNWNVKVCRESLTTGWNHHKACTLKII